MTSAELTQQIDAARRASRKITPDLAPFTTLLEQVARAADEAKVHYAETGTTVARSAYAIAAVHHARVASAVAYAVTTGVHLSATMVRKCTDMVVTTSEAAAQNDPS